MTAVKAVCFLLIITLCILILGILNNCDIRHTDTNHSPDIIFSNIYDNDYFYSRHIYHVRDAAITLLNYKSEELIQQGDYLTWQVSGEQWDNGEIFNTYSLSNVFGNTTYTWLHGDEDTPENRIAHEQSAINTQLGEYRYAKKTLEEEQGLLYRIINADGTLLFGNTDSPVSFFRDMPVYYIYSSNNQSEASHPVDFALSPTAYLSRSSYEFYLAYPEGEVSDENAYYISVKNAYVRDFTVAAVFCVLILLALALLIAGAGRRTYDEPGTVRILLIDRVFLDLGLALLTGWIVFCVIISEQFYWSIWRYKNLTAMNIFFAVMVIAVVTPFLLWLLTLSKRLKAGRFLRHTLIWSVCGVIVRFIKSLWAGFSLMVKTAAITLVSLFILFFCAALGTTHNGFYILLPILAITAAIALLLLHYAGRIRKLELGAKAVSGGDYDFTISAGGGELGRIADLINNISAGINKAVNERMKSERLKTELITNVSHDIRTPLTSIITYTDLLKSEGLDCEKAPEYLDVLINKSQRLKTLTDELFEAAKAASGSIDVNIAELDLVSLIEQVLGELDGTIKSSGLDLRIKLPAYLPVMGDGKLLWRVFENLLSNVFKYSLKNSRVYLDAERDGHFVRVDLKNISAAALNVDPSELTERFKRGDESRADGGSGLGLSIVQSFVAAQGGRLVLAIDGDLFKASVFLPCADS